MKHSGFAQNSVIKPQPSSVLVKDSESNLQNIWKSITKEVDIVKNLVTQLAKDINDLFDPNADTNGIFARTTD